MRQQRHVPGARKNDEKSTWNLNLAVLLADIPSTCVPKSAERGGVFGKLWDMANTGYESKRRTRHTHQQCGRAAVYCCCWWQQHWWTNTERTRIRTTSFTSCKGYIVSTRYDGSYDMTTTLCIPTKPRRNTTRTVVQIVTQIICGTLWRILPHRKETAVGMPNGLAVENGNEKYFSSFLTHTTFSDELRPHVMEVNSFF